MVTTGGRLLCSACENSDVFPPGSVAVAVTNSVALVAGNPLMSKLTDPDTLVDTVAVPR